LRRSRRLAWVAIAHLLAVLTWTAVDRSTTLAVDYYKYWGGNARRLGDKDGAEHAYRELLAIEPELGNAHYQLGQLLLARGADVEGLDELHAAQVLEPGQARPFSAEARWLAAHGQRAEAVVPPVGESLPNTEIFRRLAARFGFDEPCFKASDAELMDVAVDLGDLRPSEISTENALQMKGKDGRPLVLFENVFPATPSGRIELRSEALAQRWGEAALMPTWRERTADYPLMLISPASDRRITSTLGFAGAQPRLMMHPRDAEARGLAQGSDVKVWNERGEVILPLDVTDDVPRGVVASEKGAWLATSRTGQTISALVSADMRADIAEGACFNDTRVEVALSGA